MGLYYTGIGSGSEGGWDTAKIQLMGKKESTN